MNIGSVEPVEVAGLLVIPWADIPQVGDAMIPVPVEVVVVATTVVGTPAIVPVPTPTPVEAVVVTTASLGILRVTRCVWSTRGTPAKVISESEPPNIFT